MEVAVLVAKIAALSYVSVGLGLVLGKVKYPKIVESFEKSQGLALFIGMFSIIIGMLIIEHHNVWGKDWTVLVTIIGWGAVIKGVLFLACPQMMYVFKSIKCSKGIGGLVIAIGLLFGYFGFVA